MDIIAYALVAIFVIVVIVGVLRLVAHRRPVSRREINKMVCIGCLDEGRVERSEEGHEVKVCDLCPKRKYHEKLIANMEAMGGA